MKHNKAPRPDGFPMEFYQVFWELIKNDLMAFFADFNAGDLPLYSVNFGRSFYYQDAEVIKIQQYRSIYLLNINFKIFTKVVT